MALNQSDSIERERGYSAYNTPYFLPRVCRSHVHDCCPLAHTRDRVLCFLGSRGSALCFGQFQITASCARVPSELINCFSVKRMISPCRLTHHLTASMPLEWILRPSVACRKRKRSCSFLAYLSSIILVKIRNRTYGPSRSRLLVYHLSRRANPS